MKKKISSRAFFGLTALVFGHPVIASVPEASFSQSFFKSGAYGGFSFGYSYMNSTVKEAMDSALLLPPRSVSRQRSVVSNGVTGDVFAGYREFLGDGYALGADLTVALNNNTISKDMGFLYGVQAATPMTGSPQIIPAVSFSKEFSPRWLGFLKAGINITHFSFTHYIGDNGSSDEDFGSYKKTSVGPMVAAGGEYVINEKISAVGTVSYLGAQKFRQNYPLSVLQPYNPGPPITGFFPNETASTTFRPYWITAKVSFLYRF